MWLLFFSVAEPVKKKARFEWIECGPWGAALGRGGTDELLAQHLQQQSQVKRFVENRVSAEAQVAADTVVVALGADHHDWYREIEGSPQIANQVLAGHRIGRQVAHQDQIELVFENLSDHLIPRSGQADTEIIFMRQGQVENLTQMVVLFNHQQAVHDNLSAARGRVNCHS